MGTFRSDDFILRGSRHYEGLLKEGEGSQAFKTNPKWHYKLNLKPFFFWFGLAIQSNFLFVVSLVVIIQQTLDKVTTTISVIKNIDIISLTFSSNLVQFQHPVQGFDLQVVNDQIYYEACAKSFILLGIF